MKIPAEELLTLRERWISYHLYYHQDLDRLVKGFVHPVAVSLVEAAQIDAFFFVRYGLGGPHVRLRVRALPGFRDPVHEKLRRFSQDFLDQAPSTTPLEDERVRQTNRFILASDPHEVDDNVYPDNSFRSMPFRPEVQRYGGPGRLQASLDFFTLSSVAALEFLSEHGSTPRSVQLADAFRLLLQQALGFATDETELADLLRYGVDSMGAMLPKILDKGDEMARSRMDVFLRLFRQGLSAVRSLDAGNGSVRGASELLILGAESLSVAVGGADRATRAGIGGSQLHMTATRLGLGNAEEVYLSRLLTATLEAVRLRGEDDLSWVGEQTTSKNPVDTLAGLIPAALTTLVGLPVTGREEPQSV